MCEASAVPITDGRTPSYNTPMRRALDTARARAKDIAQGHSTESDWADNPLFNSAPTDPTSDAADLAAQKAAGAAATKARGGRGRRTTLLTAGSVGDVTNTSTLLGGA
jgi:hypothetical protein